MLTRQHARGVTDERAHGEQRPLDDQVVNIDTEQHEVDEVATELPVVAKLSPFSWPADEFYCRKRAVRITFPQREDFSDGVFKDGDREVQNLRRIPHDLHRRGLRRLASRFNATAREHHGVTQLSSEALP